MASVKSLTEAKALVNAAGVVVLSLSEDDLCNLSLSIQEQMPVRIVRGRKMRSVGALFDEVSSALQFPYYFGENWPAFDECMNDLSWLNLGKEFTLIISRTDELFSLGGISREDRGILFGCLARTISDWKSGANSSSIDFKLVLNFKEIGLTEIEELRLCFAGALRN